MKLNVIRYGMIALLSGLVALTAGRAIAQHPNEIQLESFSWGLAPPQTARISVAQFAFADGSVRKGDAIVARIQLLDRQGEVIAQSDEITVEPGKTRFWDAPYEQIGGVREPNGRIQLRARILFEMRSFDRDNPPLVTLEIFDSSTGTSASITNIFTTATFRVGH